MQEEPKAPAAVLPNMSVCGVPAHPEYPNFQKQVSENPTKVLEIERVLAQVIGATDRATRRSGQPLPPIASPNVHSGGVLCAAIPEGKTMTQRKGVRRLKWQVEPSAECRARSHLGLLSVQSGQVCFHVPKRPSITRRS